jgi:hypothetical protein
MRAAALAEQADALGDDADDFIDEVVTALIEADEIDPHNTRVVARRG